MCIEIIEIFLRYLTWPAIVFYFIKMFKKPVFEFLQRLETASVYGVSIKAGIPLEQHIEISKPQSEEEIKKRVEKKDRMKVITKEYTKLLKNYQFERTFNLIFGTQIQLLEHLSKKGNLGDKYINLRIFYNEFLRLSKVLPGKTIRPMMSYLEYLKDRGYIEYFGEGDELSVRITPSGDDFLSYIKEQYSTLYKYKLF